MIGVLKRGVSELRVMEFMRRAGQTIPDRPTIPDEKTRILRAKLILEEALETVRALGVAVRAKDGADFVDLTYPYPAAEPSFEFSTEAKAGTEAPQFDMVEVVDGCCDIKVVTDGTLIAIGVAGEAVQELVDESNLAKFEPPHCQTCGSEMIREDQPENGSIPGWECSAQECPFDEILDANAGPYTREDGKHIKPPYWKKPDIGGLLKAQTEAAEVGKLYRPSNLLL